MMNKDEIYIKNLHTFEKYFPGMEKQIQNFKNESESEIEIIYDDNQFLKIKKEGKTRYMTGRREPDRPIVEWFDYVSHKIKKQSVITFVGIGDGKYINYIVDRVDTSAKIFIYEPSFEIFMNYILNVDLENIMSKALIIFIVKGMNDTGYEKLLKSLLVFERLSDNISYVLPNYKSLFPEACSEFLKTMKDIEMKMAMGHNTNLLFSGVVTSNILQNIPYLLNGYKTSQLAEVIPRDIPAIIVSAGPSLNKNIHELKRAKNKAFIIAVDTAIKPLLKAGIVPDMYAVIDGLKPVELIQEPGAEEIPLMTSIAAANDVLNFHKGKKFFYAEEYYYVNKLFAINNISFEKLARGGSVATSAFSLAYMIGINTIILVGQDLALTNNRTHADGTFDEKMDEIDTSNCLMIEGNYEEKVPTRLDLKAFLDWFNYYIKGCKERRNIRVINATEGGAKIQNTELMTLKDIIDEVCIKEVDISGCIDKLTPIFGEKEQKKCKEYIEKLPKQFEDIALIARKIKNEYKKLEKMSMNVRGTEKTRMEKLFKSINKYNSILQKNDVYQFVDMSLVNADYILKKEAFYEEDTLQKELTEIARKGILYMNLIIECADMFKNFCEIEVVSKI